jgi:methane/ammonia monooxygenase subunit A
MTSGSQKVLDVAGMSPQVAKWSRTFDWMIVVIAAFLVWAVTLISFLLLAGDWDFFIDWKDRQYWVLITPVVTIMMAAAFQGLFWHLFRLPIGATASLLLFLIGVWIVRYHSWQGMAHFPISLVLPSTCLMGALALDAILCLTRSWLLTGVFGGVVYGLMFFPSNWIYLAPYFQPVEHMGQMTSLADLIGYTFPRSGTPEYIRIIERGTLRTFQDSANWVSAFFAAFICIFVYIAFWWMAIAACGTRFIPAGARYKAIFGGSGSKSSDTQAGVAP